VAAAEWLIKQDPMLLGGVRQELAAGVTDHAMV
jgi:hypothetical protein